MIGQTVDQKGNEVRAAKSRRIVDRYIRALNSQDWEALKSTLAEDLVRHSVATSGPRIESRSAFIRFLRENAAAFPDLNHEIKMIVAEEDLVASYLVMSGTQKGPMGPIEPSGRFVDIPFLAFFRIEHERIAEMWVEWDNVAFLGQLGLIPESWPLDGPELDE